MTQLHTSLQIEKYQVKKNCQVGFLKPFLTFYILLLMTIYTLYHLASGDTLLCKNFGSLRRLVAYWFATTNNSAPQCRIPFLFRCKINWPLNGHPWANRSLLRI